MNAQRLVDSLARLGFVQVGGEITNYYCTLKLDDTSIRRLDNSIQDVVTIRYIWSHERRRGHGNQAMTAITQLADEHSITLRLCPDPLLSVQNGKMRLGRLRDAPDTNGLIQWYERLGFVDQDDGNMVRVPLKNE